MLKSRKAQMLNLMIALVILIAAVFIGYVMYQSDQIDSETLAPQAEAVFPDLELKELKVCESISADYTCAQSDSVYKKGEIVFIYGEIHNLVSRANKVGFRQAIEVFNPDGESILTELILDIDREVSEEDVYQIPFKNEFITEESDVAGDYIAIIAVVDKNSGQITAGEVSFRLIE